jgi:hypothetical protein
VLFCAFDLTRGCVSLGLFHYIHVIYKISIFSPTSFMALMKHEPIFHKDITASFTVNEMWHPSCGQLTIMLDLRFSQQ